jgi:hypothetical protein
MALVPPQSASLISLPMNGKWHAHRPEPALCA